MIRKRSWFAVALISAAFGLIAPNLHAGKPPSPDAVRQMLLAFDAHDGVKVALADKSAIHGFIVRMEDEGVVLRDPKKEKSQTVAYDQIVKVRPQALRFRIPTRNGGAIYTPYREGYSVFVPQGWEFQEDPIDEITAVRDGNEIHQRIIIKYTDLADPLPWTKFKVQPDWSSEKLAAALVDDLRADKDVQDLAILESDAATVDGKPGCKVVAKFHNKEIGGLEMMKVFYSTIHRSQLYMLVFDAQVGQYYDQSLPAFEELAKTFKLGN